MLIIPIRSRTLTVTPLILLVLSEKINNMETSKHGLQLGRGRVIFVLFSPEDLVSFIFLVL